MVIEILRIFTTNVEVRFLEWRAGRVEAQYLTQLRAVWKDQRPGLLNLKVHRDPHRSVWSTPLVIQQA